MPPSSLRQPRARRYGRVTLAAAVALSVAVAVPAVFHEGGDPTMVSAAADTPGGLATSTPTAAPAPAVSERDDLPPHQGHPDAAETQTLRAAVALANATPEERAALETFFTPPPPAPEPAPVVAPAPAPVRTVSAPAVSSGSVWDRLAYCEAHGDWTTHTASGFSGGLQFADSTWRNYGGGAYAPMAWQAPREAQIVIAEKVLADVGWKAWPACSRKLGLR
jgi:hypothetical protein